MIPQLKDRKMRMVLVVASALIVMETGLLLQAGGRLSREERSRKVLLRRLSEMQQRNPYPSDANYDLLVRTRNELERIVEQLSRKWPGDPSGGAVPDAADFSARVQTAVEQFRRLAADAGVTIPPSLEAGFARYASGGVVPEQQFVPRLCCQLEAVQRISNVLIENGVASIDRLHRDEFELVQAVPEETSVRRRPRRGLPQDNQGANRPAPRPEPPKFLGVERIDVVFSAREDVIWQVLHHLASDRGGMVVSKFSHSSRTQILTYDPEAVRAGSGSEDETLKYLAEGILVGEGALTRAERIIAGDELIDVHLVVDVYSTLPDLTGEDG